MGALPPIHINPRLSQPSPSPPPPMSSAETDSADSAAPESVLDPSDPLYMLLNTTRRWTHVSALGSIRWTSTPPPCSSTQTRSSSTERPPCTPSPKTCSIPSLSRRPLSALHRLVLPGSPHLALAARPAHMLPHRPLSRSTAGASGPVLG